MKTHSVKISGLEQVNGEVCVQLKTQPFLQPSAGQFFQAFAADSEDLLPTLLYPCRVSSTELLLCGDIPKSWVPGTDLHLRGPRGNGFHLPPLTRRLALTSLGQINAFRNCLKLIPGRKTPFTVEILLEISMICDESSACGVCSVYTNRGWRMACKDGPVFALDDLPGEDGSLG